MYWPRWYPSIGGITTHIHDIVKNISNYNFEIITNAINGAERKESFLKNTIVQRIPPNDLSLVHHKWKRISKIFYPYIISADIQRIRRKYNFIKKSNHDLIHIHGPYIEPNFVSFDLKLNTKFFNSLVDFNFEKKPKILTCHGLISHISDNPLFWEMEKRVVNMFDKVICVDEYVHSDVMLMRGGSSDVQFIPNSVDINQFAYKEMKFHDKLNIGFVGRLSVERGFPLIDQLIKNKPDFIKLHLIVAGPEKNIMELKSRIRNKDITLIPNVEQRFLPEYLSQINVLLNPGMGAGISRATIEAFACGRPAIMLDIGNRYPLINNETGFLINNDFDELIELLERLNKNRDILEEMSLNARNIVVKEFSNEVIIPKIREVYNSL